MNDRDRYSPEANTMSYAYNGRAISPVDLIYTLLLKRNGWVDFTRDLGNNQYIVRVGYEVELGMVDPDTGKAEMKPTNSFIDIVLEP